MALKKEDIEGMPAQSGVYLMKNAQGKILYVGKAKSLRTRVRSYLKEEIVPTKTTVLMRRVSKLEWILTQTENDALLLECNLIKQHRPQFNVLMKDDKNFPYLCLEMSSPFPKLSIVRKVKRETGRRKNLYFGPYNQVGSIHHIMRLLNKAFQIRDCTDATLRSVERPCINYEIGTCTAPCVDYVTQEEYAKQIQAMRRFLSGESRKIIRTLTQVMKIHSENEEFERAAHVRNQIYSLERMMTHQQMISTNTSLEMDVFCLVRDPKEKLRIAIGCLSVRGGKVIGFRCAPSELPSPEIEEKEVFATYLSQYYVTNLLPNLILLPSTLIKGDLEIIEKCISVDSEEASRFEMKIASGEEDMYQLEFCRRNTETYLTNYYSDVAETAKALAEIQQTLHLKSLPQTIECVDISHFQGESTVASVVRFVDGKPQNSLYRSYTIRSVNQVDDYASMKEVLSRRFAPDKDAEGFPDLLIIDGGVGQLNAALEVLKELNINLEVVGLAKSRTESNAMSSTVEHSEERVFKPQQKNPIVLRPGTRTFQILVHCRDEAHRFAIKHYRGKHTKLARQSVLDDIKGIGPKRKRKLLSHFVSIDEILKSSPTEISSVLDCSEEQARMWLAEISTMMEKNNG